MTQTQKKSHIPMYQNTETKNKNPIKKYCSGEHKNPMIVLLKGQKNVKSFCNEMRDQFFFSTTDLFLVITKEKKKTQKK